MAIGYGVSVPKGEHRKKVKARKQREDVKALKAMRDAVWAREQVGDYVGCARCQRCKVPVYRDASTYRGEVHHIIGRRAKTTRYQPANCQLLCGPCHRAVQEHR